MKKSGILASVSLAQKANNCFGMKKSLSGNTWSGSVWDGKSVYIEKSIADHSAYLNGAKNGSRLRYSGLKGCKDYRKAAKIIKAGGYATSTTYVDKLCLIIEKWNLTKYDKTKSKKSVDMLAKEVIAGKWGNGDERKKKLTAAGYDYNAVQKRVNEIPK